MDTTYVYTYLVQLAITLFVLAMEVWRSIHHGHVGDPWLLAGWGLVVGACSAARWYIRRWFRRHWPIG
jgi:hypothetical protein